MDTRPLKSCLFALLLAAAMPAQPLSEIKEFRKGSWREKDVPKGWVQKRVGRYEIQSNCPAATVEAIGKHLNAVYDLYSSRFPATRTPGKPFTVKVFANREQYLAYGAPPSSAAYYSKHDKEMVGYDTGKTDGVTETGTTGRKPSVLDRMRDRYTLDTLAVFAHEGWHQYFHWWCTSQVPFPSWCDEGIGEYFGTARVRDGKMVVGAPNDYRLGTIKAAIKREKHIPLHELVTYDQRKYYAVAGLAYAQGWSLVHFFLEHPEYKSKRYLTRFVTEFVDKHEIEKAVEIVFRRIDWEQCEKDWKEWVLSMEYADKNAAEDADKESEEGLEAESKKTESGEPGEPKPAEGEGKPPGEEKKAA